MTSSADDQDRPPVIAARSREGRLLAGVCAGLPAVRGLSTGALRALFCVAALCGGIGIVVYLACWLVLPEAGEDPHAGGARGHVVLAWATGGLVGLLALAFAGAAAAVGLGWVVLAIACAVVAVAFAARVRVIYDVHPFVGQLATLVSGHLSPPVHDIVVFGAVDGGTNLTGPGGVATGPATGAGPLLTIHFSSLGGGLLVRDYPDAVDPDAQPNWPGFPVHVEPRPRVRGLSRRLARYELRSWRGRRDSEIADGRRIDPLIAGPCER